MLHSEVWIKRLASKAQIEIETSNTLWILLVKLIEARLMEGDTLSFYSLGYWSTSISNEFVGIYDDQKFLVPPRLELEISETVQNEAYTYISELGPYIEQITSLPEHKVTTWLMAISPLAFELLEEGHTVYWTELGSWEKCDDTLIFTPQIEFLDRINKAFKFFKLEEVGTIDPFSVDLVEKNIDFDNLYEIKPYKLRLIRDISSSETFKTDQETLIPLGANCSSSPQLDKENTPESPQYRLKWLGYLLVFLVVLGMCLLLGNYAYTQFINSKRSSSPKVTNLIKNTNLDTHLRVTMPDSSSQIISSKEERQVMMAVQPQKKNKVHTTFNPNNSNEVPIERKEVKQNKPEDIEIKADQTLEKIALQKYGHQAFWVYIYEENREHISNPHILPVGLKLHLPPASKYGIDVTNTKSLKQALLLHKSYN